MRQFSVIILTFNEEENIRRCLDSITDFTDDIIIVDSFSTDATLKICEKYGCRLFQHAFTNQALQFNWALDNVPWERPWTLRLDADEVLPDKLKQELRELTATCGPNSFVRLRRVIIDLRIMLPLRFKVNRFVCGTLTS